MCINQISAVLFAILNNAKRIRKMFYYYYLSGLVESGLFDAYHASRTFFVSGQAQHALHFGFSVTGNGVARTAAGVSALTSLVSALPIFKDLSEERNLIKFVKFKFLIASNIFNELHHTKLLLFF